MKSHTAFSAAYIPGYEKVDNGKLRLWIDLSELNKIIVLQSFPPIEDLMTKAVNCKYVLKLDIYSASCSIPFKIQVTCKTTYLTQEWHFQWPTNMIALGSKLIGSKMVDFAQFLSMLLILFIVSALFVTNIRKNIQRFIVKSVELSNTTSVIEEESKQHNSRENKQNTYYRT